MQVDVEVLCYTQGVGCQVDVEASCYTQGWMEVDVEVRPLYSKQCRMKVAAENSYCLWSATTLYTIVQLLSCTNGNIFL